MIQDIINAYYDDRKSTNMYTHHFVGLYIREIEKRIQPDSGIKYNLAFPPDYDLNTKKYIFVDYVRFRESNFMDPGLDFLREFLQDLQTPVDVINDFPNVEDVHTYDNLWVIRLIKREDTIQVRKYHGYIDQHTYSITFTYDGEPQSLFITYYKNRGRTELILTQNLMKVTLADVYRLYTLLYVNYPPLKC